MKDTGIDRESRRIPARYGLFAAIAGVLTLGATSNASQASERPRDDAEVLALVPARSDRDVQEREQLRTAAARTPGDLPTALALSRSYIEASRRDGDPRYLGAAEAALAPWLAVPDPLPAVRLLRATILQSRHEFDAALVDLARVVEQTPDDAQAWLTRATVLTVQGHYDAARDSCQKLSGLVSSTYLVACLAPIEGITGHGASATQALAQALSTARAPSEQAWLHSLAGEQDFWLGDAAASERHLRAALALEPTDRYTRALYADLLLDARRHDEARTLLVGHTADDALALRLALVELAQGRADGTEVRRVADNFDASRLRGDAVHRREEARLWLARGDAKRALDCARESWAVQREPWDARLVLEAADAARQPAAAREVIAWLDSTHFEAPRLRALSQKLEAAR